MSLKNINICIAIAVLLLTLGLAIFDSENTVVKTIAGAAGVISFFIAFFEYEDNLHPLVRYNMKAGKLFRKKFFACLVPALLAGGFVSGVFMFFIKLWRWLFLFVENHWGIILMVLGVLIALVITVFYFVSRKKTN